MADAAASGIGTRTHEPAATPRQRPRLAVLVAVEDPPSARTIRRTLRALQHRVLTVDDGLGALSAVEMYRFHAIFLGAGDRTVSPEQMALAARESRPEATVVAVGEPTQGVTATGNVTFLSPPISSADVAGVMDTIAGRLASHSRH